MQLDDQCHGGFLTCKSKRKADTLLNETIKL